MNHTGIDVGHKELIVAVGAKGKARNAKTFKNSAPGHKTIIQFLSKSTEQTLVCLEETGLYHFDLAVALSRAEGIEVIVINPKTSHNFAKVLMKRSKTDAVDAKTLATYCEKMDFKTWQCPADEMIALRAISRRIAALQKLETQTKNQLHALKVTKETPELVIEQTNELIKLLEKKFKYFNLW